MPRGKRIVIEREIDDELVDKYRFMDVDAIKREREAREETLSSSVANVFKAAQSLYKARADEEDMEKRQLYSVQSAYEYLKNNGVYISFRAFGGRIERGSVPFVKVGRKRFIPQAVLDEVVNTKDEFYSVRDAFTEYKKFNDKINYRAFIGRVEKGSIPSVKLGTKRLIPKDAVEALTHISDNYYSVSEAIKELHKSGIKIKRNAFERRLDRGRIPHVKVGGRRFIPDDVMDELVSKELALRG
jgi:hypothetical protein